MRFGSKMTNFESKIFQNFDEIFEKTAKKYFCGKNFENFNEKLNSSIQVKKNHVRQCYKNVTVTTEITLDKSRVTYSVTSVTSSLRMYRLRDDKNEVGLLGKY